MLSDRDCQLLTAFLDGELGARQHKAALRLLRRSSEARQLLRQLQEDSHALHGMPRHALPADFAARVMRVAAERGLHPGGTRPVVRPRSIPTWAGLTAAAAVLLAVTAGSFLYFSGTQTPLEGERLARPNPPPLPSEVGYRFALRDLGKEGLPSRLEQEFRNDPGWHLAVASDNPSRTVERLQTAFSKKGVQLHVDPLARASLKKKRPRATYVVYAENLRPEELTAILRQVGHADPGKGDSALLNPMSAQDRGRLAKLLGVPAVSLQPLTGPAIPLREPPIRLPDGQKEDKKAGPAPKEAGGFAVVMALEGSGNPQAVRRFLNSRRTYRPGTVQVYFVLHEASA
jgi:hypothetical protein